MVAVLAAWAGKVDFQFNLLVFKIKSGNDVMTKNSARSEKVGKKKKKKKKKKKTEQGGISRAEAIMSQP